MNLMVYNGLVIKGLVKAKGEESSKIVHGLWKVVEVKGASNG